ncbi:unnamed protein product, partial [Mesorhabditis belari]|uniref:Cadherin domain-containing protein n=1 Tax=Mesorhabditis belari TaxID=2138241 RepID=A0AAF3EZD4_9BILA
MLFLKLFLISVFFESTQQKDLLTVPTNELVLTENATENDELTKDFKFKVLPEVTEEIGISLDPPSPALNLSPSILSPGQEMKMILKDPKALRENDDSKFQVIALGLISGDEQRFPLNLKIIKNEKNVEKKTESTEKIVDGPSFEKNLYKIAFVNGKLQDGDIVVKLRNLPPNHTKHFDFRLVGDPEILKLFTAKHKDDSIVISMKNCPTCNAPFKFSFGLMGRDGKSKRRLSAIFVCRNENSESLHFSQKVYSTSLVEGSRSLARLIKLRSVGTKAQNATFTLENSNGVFAIDGKTGVLSIQNPEFISRQSLGSQLNLTTHTQNGSFNDTATILVDIIGRNELSESLPKNDQTESSFILQIGQREIDVFPLNVKEKHLKYSISEGDTFSFSIDPQIGTLAYVGSFKKETESYKLKIITQNNHHGEKGVRERNVEVKVIGLGSMIPRFQKDSITKVIDMDNPSNLIIDNLRIEDEDKDAKLEFSIHSITGEEENGEKKTLSKNLFNLTSIKKSNFYELSLERAIPLNTLNVSFMQISMSAQDVNHLNEPKAYANITLLMFKKNAKVDATLIDQLNPIPSTMTIDSSTPIGTYLFTISSIACEIENSTCSFVLNRSNNTKVLRDFRINPSTGEITTRNSLINSLNTKPYNLSITMRNEKMKIEKNVSMIVNVNQSKAIQPTLRKEKFEVTISENLPIGAQVLQIVNENPQNYRLIGEASHYFKIDEKGNLQIAEKIDAEKEETIDLFVQIGDTEMMNSIASLKINIKNENDNAPEFGEGKYSIELFDDIPLGTKIAKIEGIDKDGDELRYSIRCDCGDKMDPKILEIDGNGYVKVVNYLSKDFETNLNYSVKASDGLHEAMNKFELKVKKSQKCIPQFDSNTQKEFHIRKNLKERTLLGRVQRKGSFDEDCVVFYSIKNTTLNGNQFEIDAKTGELFVKDFLMKEGKERRNLIVQLKSGKLVKEMGIDVRIEKGNADDIEFQVLSSKLSFEIAEDFPIGSIVGRIPIKESYSLSNKLKYSINQLDTPFALNSLGEILLSGTIDAEKHEKYNLTINVINENGEKTVEKEIFVEISLQDVNDNGPVFLRKEYLLGVDRDALPGTLLITLRADDPDKEKKAIHYRLLSSTFVLNHHEKEADEIFTINSTNGELRVESFSLKEFNGGAFYVQVEANEGIDERSHKDVATLKIFVYTEESIMVMEMTKNPVEIFWNNTNAITESLSHRTGLQVIPLMIDIHRVEGHPIPHNSDLFFIIANGSLLRVLSAKEALTQMNTKQWRFGGLSPQILLMCYYRGRFLKEQQIFADRQILAQTLQRPKIAPVPLNLVFDGLYERNNPSLFQSTEYSIQEVKMNVEDEKNEKEALDLSAEYGVVDKRSPRLNNMKKNRDYATIYEAL